MNPKPKIPMRPILVIRGSLRLQTLGIGNANTITSVRILVIPVPSQEAPWSPQTASMLESQLAWMGRHCNKEARIVARQNVITIKIRMYAYMRTWRMGKMRRKRKRRESLTEVVHKIQVNSAARRHCMRIFVSNMRSTVIDT